MLGSSVSISTSSPTMHTDNANAQSSSPRLSGRLRTLSYLRNYSQAIGNERSDSSSGSERPRIQAGQAPHRTASSATVLARHNSSSHPTPELRHFRSRESPSRSSRAVSATASQAPTGGWLPSVDGSPGLARATTQLQPSPITSRRARNTSTTAGVTEGHASMAGSRNRSATSPSNALDLASLRSAARRISHPAASSLAPQVSSATTQLPTSQLPSIQLVPYQDPRSSRPSLNFSTTTRTLPDASAIIRVGRYSERDSTPAPTSTDIVSDCPVGFKSKVVSRRHCEFFYQNNSWFIKDVKSSSGTFLNHIRLSPPGEESRPYAIKDGDLVQLGIDFKGGEEMIFRCVKIRILCNRGWQKSLNKFNKSAHKRLNDLQRGASKDLEATQNSTECTICLNSIAPCQSLFVAPCSHTWHYKCIRPMLEAASRTIIDEMHFQCPNCRNVADLDADVDEGVPWDDSDEEEVIAQAAQTEADPDTTHAGHPLAHVASPDDFDNNQNLDLDDGNTTNANGLHIGNLTLDSPTSPQAQTGLNPDASSFIPSSSFSSTHSTSLSTTSTSNKPTNIALPIRRVPVPIPPLLTRQAASDSNSAGTTHGVEEDDDDDSDASGSASVSASGSGSGLGVPIARATTLAGPFNPRHLGFLPTPSSPPLEGEAEGPLTPRNNAGPFVFDGGAGLGVAASTDTDAAVDVDVPGDQAGLEPRRNGGGVGRAEREVESEGRSKRRAVHGEAERGSFD